MRRTFPALGLLLLAACSTVDGGYPSLLPRAIEGRDDAPPVRPDPVATPDSALDAKIAAARTGAQAVATRFDALAMAAETRVTIARGAALGSDAWIAAHTAMADLGATRGRMIEILSDLEAAAMARAQAGDPPYPTLDAAIADLSPIADHQAARAAALEDALAR